MNTTQPLFFPRYFTKKGMLCFALILGICSVIFFQHVLSFQWIAFGLVQVIGFFYFANVLTKRWGQLSDVIYQKKLFWVSFGIRGIWVLFSYVYFTQMTGVPFEFDAGDAPGYYGEARWLHGLLTDGKFDQYLLYIGTNYGDMGYPIYLAALWALFGDSIILPRLVKALLGAFTCVLIYKIGRNNFGEGVGRVAGIFAMLLPNLIYYCGLHVKETEMVFVVILFAYFGDKILRSKKVRLSDFLLLAVLGGLLFLFRTVLAVCLIASVGVSLFFIAKKVTTAGRRFGLLVLGIVGMIFILSSPLQKVILKYIDDSDSNLSKQMANYSKHESNSNKLAQYGTKSIFLPMMLLVPFPTLVDTDQPNPMMLGGAFFTRNVYAFFVILALISLYRQKIIRAHIFLISCLFTYLLMLGTTGFALSERFHMPAVPFLLIFAAYGVSQLNYKNKKYYIPYLIFIGLVVIGWNWFKLAGRA